MADVADIAGEHIEQTVSDALGAIKTQLHARGRCLFCGTSVQGVFCDPEDDDCRELWERSQAIKKINGR